MRNTQKVKRSEKLALLSNLMQGNSAPLVQHKRDQHKPDAYWIEARKQGVDRLVDISVMECGMVTKQRHSRQHLPDMSQTEFDTWIAGLGASTICIFKPEE